MSLLETLNTMRMMTPEEMKPDYTPLEYASPAWSGLTREQWKSLRVGRKLLVAGTIAFDYFEPDKRRAAVYPCAPRPMYLVGWCWKREGDAWFERGDGYNAWTGEYEGDERGFTPTRSVFALLVKNGLGSADRLTIPALCRLASGEMP